MTDVKNEYIEEKKVGADEIAAASKDSRFVKYVKNNWSWLIAPIIVAVVLTVFMLILKIAPFGDNTLLVGDSMGQYVPIFSELMYKLKNGGSLFYSWDGALGHNFLATYAYYTSSPFNLLLIFFDKSSLASYVTLMIVLKLSLMSGTMGYMVSRMRGMNNLFITMFGLMYALSGYIMSYQSNVMWLDSIMLFPLIVYGLDKIIRGKSPVYYIVTLFLAMWCNFYMAFMICIFLCLWFVAEVVSGRHISQNQTDAKPTRILIRSFAVFASSSVISAMMAGVLLISAYKALTHQATAGAAAPDFTWYGNILNVFKSSYFLTEAEYVTFDSSVTNLYMGVIIYPLVCLYLLCKKIPIMERVTRVVTILILVMSMDNTLLNFIWHGFHSQYGVPNRFAFLYIFVIIDMCSYVIKHFDCIGIKRGLTAACASIVPPVVTYLVTGYRGYVDDSLMVKIQIGVIIVYAAAILIAIADKSYKEYVSYTLAGMTMFELIISCFATYKFSCTQTYTLTNETLSNHENMMNYISGIEEEGVFYREDINKWLLNSVDAWHNIRGVTYFDSTVGGYFVETMAALGFQASTNQVYYTGSSELTDDIFGIRYILTENESGYKLLRDDGYNTVYDVKECLYENTDAMSIAFAVDSSIKDYNLLDTYNGAHNQSEFVRLSTGLENLYDDVDVDISFVDTDSDMDLSVVESEIDYSIDNYNADDINIIGLTFDIEEDGIYYVQTDSMYVDFTGVYINENVKIINQPCMLCAGELHKGDTVKVTFQLSPYASAEGSINLYVSKYNPEVESEFVSAVTQMDVTDYGDTYINGSIDVDDSKTLFTSIPYDEGWTVYVDGVEVETERVFGDFMGIDITAGSHSIEFKYVPEGLMLGGVVSAVGWCLFVVITVFCIKRRRSGAFDEMRKKTAQNS